MSKKNQDIEIPSFLSMKDSNTQKKTTQNNIEKTSKNNKTNINANKTNTRKPKNKKRKNKQKKKFLKRFLLIALAIGGIVALLLSPLFNVTQIKINDNVKYTQEEILAKLQIPLNENMFKISLNKYKKSLEELPYVEEVKMSRKLPNEINITLKERQAYLQIEFVNGYVYIDNQGYILEISQTKGEYKVLTGLSTGVDKYVEGGRLEEADLNKLETVQKILEHSKGNEILDSIKSIDIANEQNYILTVEDNDKKVYIGDNTNLSSKILWLKTLLTQTEGQKGIIHLEKKSENPVFEKEI